MHIIHFLLEVEQTKIKCFSYFCVFYECVYFLFILF